MSALFVDIFALIVVDRGVKTLISQINDRNICTCCFTAKHTALSSTNKDWMARNQHNVSEWSELATRVMLLQWVSTMKIKLGVLV